MRSEQVAIKVLSGLVLKAVGSSPSIYLPQAWAASITFPLLSATASLQNLDSR
jgi:hypothetical protein